MTKPDHVWINNLVAAVVAVVISAASCLADTASSISAPDGFEVSLYADDDLAHDIYSLTINARGQVVVSGPGYVRALLDKDADGRADACQTFAEGPLTGAQGLYFDGNDLLCTGDGGLLRYRDRDGNGQADGPPTRLMTMKTGGEHHAHAVQKGPDGWWYLIVGNFAELAESDVTLTSSPVLSPAAGALLRLAPDGSGTEVIADGFRNPYDFAFDATGVAFAFDSDGERDVSLPWYRPTRMFRVVPGDHAGWVTKSWKRPDYFPEMPPVLADCGRGSPTGVVAYRHHRFPKRYHNTLFALDWTFGRVLAIPIGDHGQATSSEVETFLSARGEFGFAPTDIAVAPDGSLMISVGGRGTRGGVYRVRYVRQDTSPDGSKCCDSGDRMTQCLFAPQPLAAWSRASWIAPARELGRQAFVAAIRQTELPDAARVRAIEILTELFQGLDARDAGSLSNDRCALVKARAIWSLGRRALDPESWATVALFLADDEPLVVRAALEAALRHAAQPGHERIIPRLAALLDAPDRYVRHAASNVVARLPLAARRRVENRIRINSDRARISFTLATLDRASRINIPALDTALTVLQRSRDTDVMMAAVRAAQKALGDVGGAASLPPVYDGYANRFELKLPAAAVALEKVFPTGRQQVDHELVRLIALLTPNSTTLADELIRRINDSSNPIDDVHSLIALSRLPCRCSKDRTRHTAAALVRLELKLEAHELRQDLNWDSRIRELFAQLVRHDPDLPRAVATHSEFGRPGHVVFTQQMDERCLTVAIQRIAEHLQSTTVDEWTGEIVALLATSKSPDHRELVRKQFDDFSLRSAVIIALSKRPEVTDRAKFFSGLRSPDIAVVKASVQACEWLPANELPELQFALVHALHRLAAAPEETRLSHRILRLLQHNLGPHVVQEFGHPADKSLDNAVVGWWAYLRDRFPEEAAHHLTTSEEEAARMKAMLAKVDWRTGESDRGHTLFQRQSCNGCHNARTALGPDLSGIARRFSREDVFTAMMFPNRDVSPRYNTTLIETTRGKVISGMVVYESADGLTLRDSASQTVRIDADRIDLRRQLDTSLMPAGLLDDMLPQDLADLYAYLRQL